MRTNEPRRVWVNDYEWFDVTLDESGEPALVIHSRKVWPAPPGSPPISERVKRAIEQAKANS